MIKVTREKVHSRGTGKFAWSWLYTVIGPDGYRSTGKNLVERRQWAKKRWPGHRIDETWKREDAA